MNWIDKEEISCVIEYSTEDATNEDVLATLTGCNKDILTVTNNSGSNTYLFTGNGEFTFEFEDNYGNSGELEARVSWIDKVAPYAVSVDYDSPTNTNQDVKVTLKTSKWITGIP